MLMSNVEAKDILVKKKPFFFKLKTDFLLNKVYHYDT
jgi:hypothetical protein